MMAENFDNSDDILEHALNFGAISASKRFDLELCVVSSIIEKFQRETCLPEDNKCSCQQSIDNGIRFAICIGFNGQCDGGKNRRIQF